MTENQVQEPICRSVFKSGGSTTQDQFTKKWIELINRLEKNRGFTAEKSEKAGT